MKAELLAALDAVGDGFSPDRIVADPALIRRFLEECARLGLTESSRILNRALLNLRKRGELRGRGSRKTSFKDRAEYSFAVEIAVRFLERRDKVTLDDIICDQTLAEEFDAIAGQLYPGASSLQYRWAALNLRKTRKLEPEILARVAPPTRVINSPVDTLDLDSVPASPGLYLFFSSSELLYVGECENLNNRIRKHLNHSDNKSLAQWLWQHGLGSLHVELQVLESSIGIRVRRALETELILSREPLFNIRQTTSRKRPKG